MLAAVACLAACSSDETPSADPSFEQEIKTELKQKSELPAWLADYIDYLEYVPKGERYAGTRSGIYRFELDGLTYYEISSTTQSKVHEEVYAADGTPIALTEKDYRTLSDGARNWTIVYLFRPGYDQTVKREEPWDSECMDSYLSLFLQETFPKGMANNGIKFGFSRLGDTQCNVVDSDSQLRNIYVGDWYNWYRWEILPSKASMVIGRTHVPRGASLVRQELVTAGDSTVLHLYYERPMGIGEKTEPSTSPRYFCCLYPKTSIPSEQISLRLSINNQVSYYTWNQLQAAKDSLYLTSDWESPLLTLKPLTGQQFSQATAGGSWQETAYRRIRADGTVEDNPSKVEGQPVCRYEFREDSVVENGKNDVYSYTVPYQIHYSELNNMVYRKREDYVAAFQVVSITDRQMEIVKRVHYPEVSIGSEGELFYLVTLQRVP